MSGAAHDKQIIRFDEAPRRYVECFVAACSGTACLTEEVGHPVVHVGVSNVAVRSIADLNAREHGSGTLWPWSFQPLEPQRGDDWAMFSLETSADPSFQAPLGAVIEDGVIRLAQPQGITMAEMREQLSGALMRLRFQDVVRQPRWLEARSDFDPFAEIVVHPRYAFSDRDFRRATLVPDLVVLHPSQEATRLCGCSSEPAWRRRRRGRPVGGKVTGVELGGEALEGDAVVIAMGPWSQLARRWLPLPAVYALKGHSLVFDTGKDLPPEALFLEHCEDSPGSPRLQSQSAPPG